MIVSASYRTDLPAFYADWFLARLAAGECTVANPYGGPPARVDLRPGAVDGWVFWTRNLAPFEAALDRIAERAEPFVVQFTATGYPRALERSVIPAARAIAQCRAVRARFGPDALVWRYDPIVLTDAMDAAWHRARFATLAKALSGATGEVVVSFLAPYRKTRRNLDRAAAVAGFAWRLPGPDERRALLADLAAIAGDAGMRLTLCAQPADESARLPAARCIDAERLSRIAGRPVRARTRGNRPGCACAESRDIGAYDSCPHGCAYCYAVASRGAAARRHGSHDRAAAMLGAAP
ncbi:MAG: DUF1848 domain-containing protein [Alphaproteobacteria bacterium]